MNKRNILVTGGSGFIGSHLVTYFVNKYPQYNIINIDALTYAADNDYLNTKVSDKSNYTFIKGDICDVNIIENVFDDYEIDSVIHLAAESHVDNSISEPLKFAQTNILGTLNLLSTAVKKWDNFDDKIFYHVSTDEVYGEIEYDKFEDGERFTESTPYQPHSPYSASKASADHFVRAYFDTYKLPIKISNCSNNYGPGQHIEKLIPKVITNILYNKPIPVYGKGDNMRDWIFVEDHVSAIDKIFHEGSIGETYCISGNNVWTNISMIETLIWETDKLLGRPLDASTHLITFVEDRKGHDTCYAIDASKLRDELGWVPEQNFHNNIKSTIKWYIDKYSNKGISKR